MKGSATFASHIVSNSSASGKRKPDQDDSIVKSSREPPAKQRKTVINLGFEYQAKIGVLRLDGWGNVRTTRTGEESPDAVTEGSKTVNAAYVPLIGDVDDARSFQYPAFAAVAKGCTWEVLKEPSNWSSQEFLDDIKTKVQAAFKKLVAQDVKVITANCGLFMWLHSKGIVNPALGAVMEERGEDAMRPMVSLSSLNMLPYTLSLYGLIPHGMDQSGALVVVFTSNESACSEIIKATPPLSGYKCFTHEEVQREPTLKREGGILVIGLNGDNVIGVNGKVAGFECVNDGTAVYYDVLQPGIKTVAVAVKKQYPNTRLAIVECTEVSAYSDTIRNAMKVPVYDPISLVDTMLDSFIPHGYQQISHKERTTYIRTVLHTPVNSMKFELTFLPSVVSEAKKRLEEDIANISAEEESSLRKFVVIAEKSKDVDDLDHDIERARGARNHPSGNDMSTLSSHSSWFCQLGASGNVGGLKQLSTNSAQ